MTDVLVKRGNLDTGMHTGRMPCEGKGRDLCDAFTVWGTPDCRQAPEAGGEAWSRFLLTVSRRNQPPSHLLLRLQLPELWDSNFVLLWCFVTAAWANEYPPLSMGAQPKSTSGCMKPQIVLNPIWQLRLWKAKPCVGVAGLLYRYPCQTFCKTGTVKTR